MKVEVYNIKGESTGRNVELPDNIFGVEPNTHAMWLDVKQYLAHQRQGTHKTKERGEIAGSTRKIKKQKGTGTARMGSLKNPILRGGGRTFGPRPRNYTIRLNKKVKSLARKSALSTKASEGSIKIVEDFTFDAPRTREFVNILKSFELDNAKTMLVAGEIDKTLYLASRNVPNSTVIVANELNTYSIMNANTLVLAESAVAKIKEVLD